LTTFHKSGILKSTVWKIKTKQNNIKEQKRKEKELIQVKQEECLHCGRKRIPNDPHHQSWSHQDPSPITILGQSLRATILIMVTCEDCEQKL
jgi:hypothetical protein